MRMNKPECASNRGALLQMVVTVLRALEVAWLMASGNIGEFSRVKVSMDSSLILGRRATRADAELLEMVWERAMISHF